MDKSGCEPLPQAAGEGRTPVCEVLLNNGAAADARNESGLNPLHRAAERGFTSVCEVLLNNGAAVDARNESGACDMCHTQWQKGNKPFDGRDDFGEEWRSASKIPTLEASVGSSPLTATSVPAASPPAVVPDHLQQVEVVPQINKPADLEGPAGLEDPRDSIEAPVPASVPALQDPALPSADLPALPSTHMFPSSSDLRYAADLNAAVYDEAAGPKQTTCGKGRDMIKDHGNAWWLVFPGLTTNFGDTSSKGHVMDLNPTSVVLPFMEALRGRVNQGVAERVRAVLQMNVGGGRMLLEWLWEKVSEIAEGSCAANSRGDVVPSSSVRRLVMTGHSVGGEVATLLMLVLLEGLQPKYEQCVLPYVACITFGSPLVVDRELAEWLEAERPGVVSRMYHVVGQLDPVPRLLIGSICPETAKKLWEMMQEILNSGKNASSITLKNCGSIQQLLRDTLHPSRLADDKQSDYMTMGQYFLMTETGPAAHLPARLTAYRVLVLSLYRRVKPGTQPHTVLTAMEHHKMSVYRENMSQVNLEEVEEGKKAAALLLAESIGEIKTALQIVKTEEKLLQQRAEIEDMFRKIRASLAAQSWKEVAGHAPAELGVAGSMSEVLRV